jgi:hypothetical protein
LLLKNKTSKKLIEKRQNVNTLSLVVYKYIHAFDVYKYTHAYEMYVNLQHTYITYTYY